MCNLIDGDRFCFPPVINVTTIQVRFTNVKDRNAVCCFDQTTFFVGVVNDAVVSLLYLAGQSTQAEFVVCIALTAQYYVLCCSKTAMTVVFYMELYVWSDILVDGGCMFSLF